MAKPIKSVSRMACDYANQHLYDEPKWNVIFNAYKAGYALHKNRNKGKEITS